MNELALFAGAGGGILGGKLLGWRTVCAVERDAYAAQILAQRQNDGVLEPFPIWSDVCSFDGKPWRGIVDVVSGGFPCQDISAAGKGAGIEGARSGMWKEMARIIGEVRPKYAFVENSPMLTTRGLGTVLGDLASLGFDAEWGVLSAADVGAPHRRERIWILGRNSKWELADTNLCRHENRQAKINTTKTRLNAQRIFSASRADVADTKGLHCNASEHNAEHSKCKISESGNSSSQKDLDDTNMQHGQRWGESQQPSSDCRETWNQPSGCSDAGDEVSNATSVGQSRQRQSIQSMRSEEDENWQANLIESIGQRSQWQTEPDVGRVANGLAFTVDRLKAIGNGQVPLCAATAFKLLRDRLNDN